MQTINYKLIRADCVEYFAVMYDEFEGRMIAVFYHNITEVYAMEDLGSVLRQYYDSDYIEFEEERHELAF